MKIKEMYQKLRLTSPFGERVHPVTGKKDFHNGIDLAAPVGTQITAHTNMEVLNVWENDLGGKQCKVADDNYVYGFAHLSHIFVKAGQKLKEGDLIALTGNSGASTGAHLHLTTRDKKTQKLLNPEIVLKNLILIFVLFLFSCTAGYHIDKAVIKRSPKYVVEYTIGKYGDSFLDKHIEKIYDTVYTKEIKFDTILFGKKIDTLVINRDNATIKIFKYYDTIFTSVKVKRDTIIKTIYKDRYVIDKKDFNEGNYFGKVFMWIFIIVFLIQLFIILVLIGLSQRKKL
jgi:hypothetical protein